MDTSSITLRVRTRMCRACGHAYVRMLVQTRARPQMHVCMHPCVYAYVVLLACLYMHMHMHALLRSRVFSMLDCSSPPMLLPDHRQEMHNIMRQRCSRECGEGSCGRDRGRGQVGKRARDE